METKRFTTPAFTKPGGTQPSVPKPAAQPIGRGYLPKVQVGTVKSVAKNLLRAKFGTKKISETKFKKFLKSEADLRKFAYKPGTVHITKGTAKKFFQKVLTSAEDRKDMRVSKLAAKKMGFRIGAHGELSKVGLNKMYRNTVNTEIAANQPTGPTPQEIERAKRHENMLKTIHKWERARDIEAESKQAQRPTAQQPRHEQATMPTLSHGSTGPTTAPRAHTSDTDRTTSYRPPRSMDKEPGIPIVILPCLNSSSEVAGTAALCRKLDAVTDQVLSHVPRFQAVPLQPEYRERYQANSSIDAARSIAHELGATAFVIGVLKRSSGRTNITITLHQVHGDDHLTLAAIDEATMDAYTLQRKAIWDLAHAVHNAQALGDDSSLPSSGAAVDLPI